MAHVKSTEYMTGIIIGMHAGFKAARHLPIRAPHGSVAEISMELVRKQRGAAKKKTLYSVLEFLNQKELQEDFNLSKAEPLAEHSCTDVAGLIGEVSDQIAVRAMAEAAKYPFHFDPTDRVNTWNRAMDRILNHCGEEEKVFFLSHPGSFGGLMGLVQGIANMMPPPEIPANRVTRQEYGTKATVAVMTSAIATLSLVLAVAWLWPESAVAALLSEVFEDQQEEEPERMSAGAAIRIAGLYIFSAELACPSSFWENTFEVEQGWRDMI